MTIEQYNRGYELQFEIDALKRQRNIWEEATCFKTVQVDRRNYPNDNCPVNLEFVDFNGIQTYTIQTINNLIRRLESEFANL